MYENNVGCCPIVSETERSTCGDWGNVDVRTAVAHVRAGDYLRKYCRSLFKTNPHERLFHVDFDSFIISWTSPNKTEAKTKIPLNDVIRIIPGSESRFWDVSSSSLETPPSQRKQREQFRYLSIEIVTKHRILRLECPKSEVWKLWMKGLTYAQKKADSRKHIDNARIYSPLLTLLWRKCRLTTSGTLSYKEMLQCFNKSGILADSRYVAEIFDELDSDGAESLDYNNFVELVHRITVFNSIQSVFDSFKNLDTDLLHIDGLQLFLKDVQAANDAEMTSLINAALRISEGTFRLSIDREETSLRLKDILFTQKSLDLPGQKSLDFSQRSTTPLGFSQIGFSIWISQPENSIAAPDILDSQEDMTKPFSQYFIYTVRNALADTQATFRSDSLVLRRNRKTIDSRLVSLFADGCRCLDFRIVEGTEGEPFVRIDRNSPFISFKKIISACSKYAFQFNPYPLFIRLELEKDKPYLPFRVAEILASAVGHIVCSEAEVTSPMASPKTLRNRIIIIDESGSTELGCISAAARCGGGVIDSLRHPLTSSRQQKRRLEGFRDVVALTVVSYSDDCESNQVSIVTNDALTEIASKRGSSIIESINSRKMVLVTPSVTAGYANDFDPTQAWNTGAQFVAIPINQRSRGALLNHARFMQNGNCGYVTKRPDLRKETPVNINIRLISSRQLPRLSTDPIIPSVRITVHQGISRTTQQVQSAIPVEVGCICHWQPNEVLCLTVNQPSAAILVFEVLHQDNPRPELLACAALPVIAVRAGIRWVPLRDQLLRPIKWAGLLVEVDFKSTRPPPPMSRNKVAFSDPISISKK